MSAPLTVRDLRARLASLPDDMVVWLEVEGGDGPGGIGREDGLLQAKLRDCDTVGDCDEATALFLYGSEEDDADEATEEAEGVTSRDLEDVDSPLDEGSADGS